ncbi:enoyl-CoA hydratase/isomerase family protein [Flagellimonas sp. CMM7]|uniref:enoyl-CoA hydratase/isomerase family protein n=1 Tax=Flagellimonas sp. CMM7 TaxID=2654676 RepID=UPI0013CFDB9E|nr:enoyl-CoA hydratase/isomerase family protein [Flagellimonas sp. CMM7]UII78772.1 enoyl-CoA hydratase/isomerase family protein [Flagellimonas sp. CMM7]
MIEYSNTNGIATIEINNPPQNRLVDDLLNQLDEALNDIMRRNDTRVVYLKATGDNFSFGGDILPWTSMTEEEINGLLAKTLKTTNTLENLPIPVISAIQGNCLGGGFELVLRTDVILAAKNAKFGHPEASIGLFTLLGGVQRVADRIGRTRAMQWALTCELIDADYAERIGLINEAVPEDILYKRAEEWVEKLVSTSTLAHADHKRLLRKWSDSGVEAADKLMPEIAGKIMLSNDAQGAIASAIHALKEGKARPKFPFKGK